MKNATLIAIISLSVIILIDLMILIIRYFDFYRTFLYEIFNIINIFAFAGLLLFFIRLYQRQKE